MTSGLLSLDDLKQQALTYTSVNYETSATYPNNYGVTAGNFDGQGCSWGSLQFNLGSGTLQPIWNDLNTNHPDVCQAAITVAADYTAWTNMLADTSANQVSWGASITDPNNANAVIEPWKTYLMNLGITQESINRQIQASQTYYNLASGWVTDFGLWSRRGYSLCFDIAVQSGGMATACHTDIMNYIAAMPDTLTPQQAELFKMRFIAFRRAQDVTGQFHQSYLDRKMAIANGSGVVYGGQVSTVNYDLILEPNGINPIPAGKIPSFVLINHNVTGG